jgi:hypothetical protein
MAAFAKTGRDLRLLAAGGRALAAARWHGRALRPLYDRTRRIGASDVLLLARLEPGSATVAPSFLDHYRGLGVGHFILLAQGDAAGAIDEVVAADDVSLWSAPAALAPHAAHWCNALLRRYGSGHLCVTVAAGEFLLYPFMATRSLHALGQFLLDDRRLGMAAIEIDGTGAAIGVDPVRIPVVWWRRHYAYRGSNAHALPLRLERVREAGRLAPSGCLFRPDLAAPRQGLPAAADLVARGVMSRGAWF